jgi:SSS family solute:Na+ symporter
MDRLIISVITLGVYIGIGTLIAIISRRAGIKSGKDYFVAGYRLSGVLAAMTYAATTYSAFMMVGLVGLTYMTGVGAFGFEITYLIATIFLLTTVTGRVWKLARQRGWISPAEMIADLYGLRILAIVVAVIYLIALIPYASAQLIGVGVTVEGMGGGHGLYVYGILLGVVVALLWTAIAGIWSVASTDAFQGVWMMSAALGLVVWLYAWGFGSPEKLAEGFAVIGDKGYLGLTPAWSLPVYISFTVPWIFFAVTNPQVVQKIYMPRDKSALQRMVTLFTIFGLSYTLIVTLIGLMGRALTELGTLPEITYRDAVTPTILSYAPLPLAALVFASIVAAAMSTMDAIVLTLSSTASRDLYVNALKGREERMIWVGRASIVIILAVLASVAYLRPGFIVDLSVLTSALLLPLAPVTLVGWLFKEKLKSGSGYAALASLLTGFAIGISWALVNGARKALLTPILGIPSSAFILIVSSAVLGAGLIAQHIITSSRRR